MLCALLACDPKAPDEAQTTAKPPPRPARCEQLAPHASEEARAAWVFVHACDAPLDERGQARLLSAIDSPTQAVGLMPELGDDPERLGVAKLIAGQFDGPAPEHIDDPSSAVVFPIDHAVLGQVGRAYRLLFAAGHPLSDRQWAHAYLAKVHLHALRSLPQQDPLSPAQTWLAGRAVHHARRAFANVQRSPRRITSFIRSLESELSDLHRRLDAAPPHGDPLLVAVERERYRQANAAPLRLADVERLVGQGFGDWAVERALAQDDPTPWLAAVRERADAAGLPLRGLPAPDSIPDEAAESGTETGQAQQPATELVAGPAFPTAQELATPLVDAMQSASDPEARAIALADAAWTMRRRPDVAATMVGRTDALGELARRFLANRGDDRWRLERATEPEERRRLRFAATRDNEP